VPAPELYTSRFAAPPPTLVAVVANVANVARVANVALVAEVDEVAKVALVADEAKVALVADPAAILDWLSQVGAAAPLL